jgi:hypothetical protein
MVVFTFLKLTLTLTLTGGHVAFCGTLMKATSFILFFLFVFFASNFGSFVQFVKPGVLTYPYF